MCVPASRSQQLCVKLEPRGLLYVKLSLQEKWDTQVDKCLLLQCYHGNNNNNNNNNCPRSAAQQQLAHQRVWS